MAIEKQPIPMRSGSEDPIELELVQQPDEETELFVQPDGSIVRGSDMEEETPSKFGENLAEVLDANLECACIGAIKKVLAVEGCC